MLERSVRTSIPSQSSIRIPGSSRVPLAPTSDQSTSARYRHGEKLSPGLERFDDSETDRFIGAGQKIDLLSPTKTAKGKRPKNPLTASSASASGKTIAILWEKEFWVYKVSDHPFSVHFRYVGNVDRKGLFHGGIDPEQLRPAGSILNDELKDGFSCVSVSDDLLAVGKEGSGSVLFFYVGDGAVAGYSFTLPHNGRIVRKLLFNPDGSELAMIFTASELPRTEKARDICHIYSVPPLKQIATQNSRQGQQLEPLPLATLWLDTTYDSEKDTYTYETRHARFSLDGNKLVFCTNHNHGSALVFILFKDKNTNEWEVWGRYCLINRMDNWDNDCLGFTGVSLFHLFQDRIND